MDSLFAKADAIKPFVKRHKTAYNSSKNHIRSSSKELKDTSADHTAQSIAKHTSVPKSLLQAPHESSSTSIQKYPHIKNNKLRAELQRQSAHNARAKALVDDSADLLVVDAGKMEVEDKMDRTWRTGQEEILYAAGQEAAKGRKELRLDGGPYRIRYTRNGRYVSLFMLLNNLSISYDSTFLCRHLVIAGRLGHVAAFDWQTGTLHTELQLQETCRDITFLQDQTFFAVAQKKYVYIYDRDGVEIHRLKSHIEPTRLEFLPYHWLLASVVRSSAPSILKSTVF